MRAVQITASGGPEILALAELPDPPPGPGQLLVEVAAAGVNYIDTYKRRGVYPLQLPFVLGQEGAGRVGRWGPATRRVRRGRPGRLVGLQGGYAERVATGPTPPSRCPTPSPTRSPSARSCRA